MEGRTRRTGEEETQEEKEEAEEVEKEREKKGSEINLSYCTKQHSPV